MTGFEVFIFIVVPVFVIIGSVWAVLEARHESNRPFDWERDT